MMLYNALLQGQFRESIYSIKADKTNPFYYTFSNSANITFPSKRRNVMVSYNFFTYRSAEFRKSDFHNSKSHTWGGIYFTVAQNLK
jgi:hypothetical protein